MPCQRNTQSGLGKPRGHNPLRKIVVTSKSPVGDVSVVTLIRTDTTLDHSQKAEKVCSQPCDAAHAATYLLKMLSATLAPHDLCVERGACGVVRAVAYAKRSPDHWKGEASQRRKPPLGRTASATTSHQEASAKPLANAACAPACLPRGWCSRRLVVEGAKSQNRLCKRCGVRLHACVCVHAVLWCMCV